MAGSLPRGCKDWQRRNVFGGPSDAERTVNLRYSALSGCGLTARLHRAALPTTRRSIPLTFFFPDAQRRPHRQARLAPRLAISGCFPRSSTSKVRAWNLPATWFQESGQLHV